MSETIKTSESARKMTEASVRAAQMAGDASAALPKDAEASAQVFASAAESAKQSERNAHAGGKLADSASTVARLRMDATAEAGDRIADMGYDRGRRLLASSVQAMDIYTDATERSAERVQAMLSSAFTLTRGMQKMQYAWLELLDGSMERAAHRPQDLLRCKSLSELAEVQCELYTDAVDRAFKSSSRMLELAGQMAQEAMRPLQSRASGSQMS